MNGSESSLPIEQFIQAFQAQLDRAQSAMALKARNLNLPLTFAVKDLSIDLRAHVEVVQSQVRIRPAGPNDRDANVIHMAFTSITRPMIEENSVETLAAPDEPTVKEALGDQLSDDEQRRLEWAGIHTIGQLREVERRRGAAAIERVSQLPVDRLRAALHRAAQPQVTHVSTDDSPASIPEPSVIPGGSSPAAPKPGSWLRIRGRNLLGQNRRPAVRIAGQDVPIVSATDSELVVAPLAHQFGGDLVVETDPGLLSVVKLPPPAASTVGAGTQPIPIATTHPSMPAPANLGGAS